MRKRTGAMVADLVALALEGRIRVSLLTAEQEDLIRATRAAAVIEGDADVLISDRRGAGSTDLG